MGLWDDICDGASAIGGAVGGVVHGVEEGVVQGVQRVVEDVRDTVNGIVDTVIGVVVGAAEAIGQAFGVNPHGSPTTPCPYAPTPPRVGDLSVLVKRRDNDQPIPGAAVSVGTLTRRNGTTGGQGTISFDNLREGPYQVEASNAGMTTERAPATVNAGQCTSVTLRLGAQVLRITAVDDHFAPGVETLTVTYDIDGLDSTDVMLKITSDTYPNNPIMSRPLTATEKASGTGKTITLTGASTCSAGRLAGGKFVNPAFSPYKAALEATGGPRDERAFQVLIQDMTLDVVNAAGKWNMNNPVDKFECKATVLIKKKDNSGVVAPALVDVKFTFSDPGGNNTTDPTSFHYPPTPTALGKAGNAAAIFWEGSPACITTADDGFKTNVKVETLLTGADLGKAKTFFKPAGVGGDDFKIKATALGADGTSSLLDKESAAFTVIRSVTFSPYEMTGQSHISTHGTTAKMAAYYTAATFVTYTLGTVTTLPANRSVKYIGLWDHSTLAMRNWATHQQKIVAETPTAQETTDANGPAGAAQTAARAAIQTKANAWRDRIVNAYNQGMANWAPDAAVPVNSMVAVQFEHPKYSVDAPNADSTTNEWTAFPWLTITIEGRTLHPDRRWVNGQGVSIGQRAYVMAGMTAARTEVAVAHEAGHETKNQFKKDVFGPGDHSAAAGLMDPVGSLSAFTAREIKILRGIIP